MKQTISIFLAVLIFSPFFMNAQNRINSRNNGEKLSETVKKSIVENSRKTSKTKADVFETFNFALTMDSIKGYVADVYTEYLWPDSTMKVLMPDSSLSLTIYKSIGEFVNPNSVYFHSFFPKCVPSIYLDHIGFYGFYKRNPAMANVVDTLMVQVKIEGDGEFYYYDLWVWQYFGTDTLLFKGLYNDYQKTYSTRPGYITYKFPLDSNSVNDTISGGINYFNLPVNLYLGDLGYGSHSYPMFGVTFSFIPGYSWSPNVDTINNFNYLKFISYEENGNNGGVGTFPSYTKRDWNCSYVNTIDIKYHPQNNVLLTPSYVYLPEYKYEHHFIDYVLRYVMTSVPEKGDLRSRIKVRPNPVSERFYIDLQNIDNSIVTVELYDVAGSRVFSRIVDCVGKKSVMTNVGDLSPGIYFYKISAGNNFSSGKLIIVNK